MKNKIYQILTVVIFMCCNSCNNEQHEIKIEPINGLDTILNSRSGNSTKLVYYKVVGFKQNAKNIKTIESFIEKNHKAELSKYSAFVITLFYPPSDESDEIGLKLHPDRYYNLENTLCEYRWLNGKFLSKTTFENGRAVDKNKVTVTDAPLRDK